MEDVNNKNRKLIKALELITDYELTKPLDKIDGDLIDSAVNWSLRLQNKDITLSTEEIEEMVSMIPFTDTEEPETDKEVQKSVKVLKKKKVLFIAAIITILVTLLTVVSVAFERNIFDELKNRFGTVADTPVDEELVVNGVTVVMNGEYRKYSTIEDALKEENIDILYPSYLPDGIVIEKVSLYQQINVDKLLFSFNDDNITMEIILDGDFYIDIKSLDIEVISNLSCYVCEKVKENCVQYYFKYNDDWYMIKYNNKQDVIRIIESLKELE